MSSAVLYLAIVAVWAVVLVPMWLRRDTDGITRLLPKRNTEDLDEEPTLEEDEEEEDEAPAPHRRPSRAAIIARRRRRTAGLTLLLLTVLTLVAVGIAPWWTTLPPALFFAGHLALLRVAVGMDDARRRAAEERALVRAEALEAARQAAAAEPAEIIELAAPEEEVFDQYAEERRAVGE